MRLLDVNVVLAAHRADHPQFAVARPWLDGMLAEHESFSVTDLVAGAFLRIATNRRIFSIPTPLDDAFAYLRALRAQSGHALVGPGPRHLSLLESLCRDSQATGDLVADAQLAAIAVEHACELVSFDRDFARFERLSWSRPQAPGGQRA